MSYKNVFLLLSISILFVSFTVDPIESDLKQARIYFKKARTSENEANQLLSYTASRTSIPIFKAYHGAANALLAKFVFNPFDKLEYMHKGLDLLNNAVTLKQSDIEIRFLRLVIEEHIPPGIPFNNHIVGDRNFIISHLNPNHSYYKEMNDYLNKT